MSPSSVIPLPPPPPAPKAAPKAGGCAASACGTSPSPGDLPAGVWNRVKNHPCYSEEAHHYFARMHVSVAPGCNIQCLYCNRKYDCANESRPGVTSERLTPEQAARKVAVVAAEVPQLSVLGIAGPGDALHDAARTFETFDRVAERLPDLTLCLSTNGLALPDHVDAIVARGIHHVTVTITGVSREVSGCPRSLRHASGSCALILLPLGGPWGPMRSNIGIFRPFMARLRKVSKIPASNPPVRRNDPKGIEIKAFDPESCSKTTGSYSPP